MTLGTPPTFVGAAVLLSWLTIYLNPSRRGGGGGVVAGVGLRSCRLGSLPPSPGDLGCQTW